MNLDFLGLSKDESEKIKELISDKSHDFDYDEILKVTGIDVKELEVDMLNYKPKLDLGFTKLNDEAVTPFYNYPSDSGFDLYATQMINITKFGRALIPTGLSFDIKDGYEIQVRSKSGLAINKGLMVLNSPGTVDNGYTGEVQVIIFNTNDFDVTIEKGMKVGQAVLCPVVNGAWVNLVEHKNVTSKDRGDKGFGSTGV